MADSRIRKRDADRLVAKYRRLLEEDPERWKGLRMLVEDYPDDYDPDEPTEDANDPDA